MIRKTVMWVCGVVFVAALSFPALADQSIGFKQYFNEGVKAFKEHDDRKALRCFKIAQIYDPSDGKLNKYLSIMEQRGVVLETPLSQLSDEESVSYEYYFKAALQAFQQNEDKKAIRYFKIAKIFSPSSQEADHYLKILYSRQGSSSAPVSSTSPQEQTAAQPESQGESKFSENSSSEPSQKPAVTEASQVTVPQTISQPQPQPYASSEQYQPSTVVSKPPALYIPEQKAKAPLQVISLATITNNGQIKPRIQIAYQSSVMLEGKNIQRFLIVEEGFIQGKITDPDHLRIDALRIGTTFLHVWDNSGRSTLYIEVVFPKYNNPYGPQAVNNGVRHSQPFQFKYSNDWSTYYSGKNIPQMKRQSYEFTEDLGVTGETPYGFFDASGSYLDFNGFTKFDSYTIGLSQIPVPGTTNFNVRGFDALRYLSPLTLPGTRLRGVFADIDLMGGAVGLSFSHGQEQIPLGFLAVNTEFAQAYVDAAKLTLFPKSTTDQYAVNFATSYGPDRQRYLSNHVYSVEGLHKINDALTLNAEQGSDTTHQSTLAALHWKEGVFRSDVAFRDIDKNYTTISTLPSYQGEVGSTWTTTGEFKNFTENTFLEAYRDRLDANLDHPNAFNYDGNGQLHATINENYWSDSDFNFVDTAGELSPTNSLGVNERISRGIGIWKSLKATVYSGVGYQNSHSQDTDISDYDRENVVAGIQLPITSQVSTFVNYEYDWLHQPEFGNSNPSIINAGIQYQRQISSKLSINSQVSYHDELGVQSDNNSFLSGEESVIISSGFNYVPTPDVNIFFDGDASKILSHTGSPSYDDFEVHLGMRINFGGATYWDPLGTVSGIVFKDKDGTGKFVKGDQGIPGVKIKVGDKEAITDKSGHYSIRIRARGVDVVPVLDTIPGGLLFSTPQALNIMIFQGRTSHADFGLISQTGVYGIVFVSKNGSNVPSEGDKFVGKVRVILDGKVIQRSDVHGAFYFRNVSPGQHDVSIDINTLELNMVPLVKLKNKIDVSEGTNYAFNIPIKIEKAENEEK